MMNLMHWKLLVAVADKRNISQAAESVGLSQSGASQAISQIEKTLDVAIFHREHQQTLPTAIGEKIVLKARNMIAELEAIQNLANMEKGHHCGRITLACFPSVFARQLPSILRNFKRRHPNIDIISLQGTDHEVTQWLQNNQVDLGVQLNPPPEQHPVMLGHDTWVVAVPNRHHLARQASSLPITMQTIVDQAVILVTGGCQTNGQSIIKQHGLSLSNIVLEVTSWDAGLTLVREEIGIAIVPSSVISKHQQGIRIYPLSPSVHRYFGLVCSEQGKQVPAVQEFLRLLNTPETEKPQPLAASGV